MLQPGVKDVGVPVHAISQLLRRGQCSVVDPVLDGAHRDAEQAADIIFSQGFEVVDGSHSGAF